MSDKLKLGQIITTEQFKDAIHVAVAPVTAGMPLLAGSHVLLDAGVAFQSNIKAIGVVDPFLKTSVFKGERFWLFLYPGSITSLRHDWSHPSFSGPSEPPRKHTKAESEAWLRDWIKRADCPDYDTVMAAAVGAHVEPIEDYASGAYKIQDYGDGPRLYFSGRDAHSEIPTEFWDHVENVTGVKVPVRAVGFSCSC